MQREMLIKIFSQLPEDSMLEALQVAGAPVDEAMMGEGDIVSDLEPQMEPWNRMQVEVPGEDKRPQFFDKNRIQKVRGAGQQQQQQPQYPPFIDPTRETDISDLEAGQMMGMM